MSIRAVVLGATGYTGLEIVKLLMRHPEVALTMVTSRTDAGVQISEVHPELKSVCNLNLRLPDVDQISEEADVVYSCLPHAASAQFVCSLNPEIKVIDFSADYRLNDLEVYESLYKVAHPQPERLGKVPYGIPELFRKEIGTAKLVANPGCFPTSAILPLSPLLKTNLIEEEDIIIDSKTGISGAGRNAKLRFHFPEINENTAPYSIGSHRHGPEIDDVLGRFSGKTTQVVFTPNLVPMTRGLISTIYVKPAPGIQLKDVRNCLQNAYQNEPFIRLLDTIPESKAVCGTNFCDIGIFQSQRRIVIVSAIDNLVKGASGAALQNMNVMFGLNETLGL